MEEIKTDWKTVGKIKRIEIMNDRYFYIKDVDCTITVEYATRKEMLEMVDNYVENCKTRDEIDDSLVEVDTDDYAETEEQTESEQTKTTIKKEADNMANVKHTTNNGEVLTTECKKFTTAIRRFTAFLKEYDRYYNEMLSEINGKNLTVTHDTCDTETVTMLLSISEVSDIYTLTIKHNVKATVAEQPEAEATAEQTAEQYDVITDSYKVLVSEELSDDELCTITAYENRKQLSLPIAKMHGITHVLEYVKCLYDSQCVQRETCFVISRENKHNVVLTYTNVHNILHFNTSERNTTND